MGILEQLKNSSAATIPFTTAFSHIISSHFSIKKNTIRLQLDSCLKRLPSTAPAVKQSLKLLRMISKSHQCNTTNIKLIASASSEPIYCIDLDEDDDPPKKRSKNEIIEVIDLNSDEDDDAAFETSGKKQCNIVDLI